jgi:hypothetical protein
MVITVEKPGHKRLEELGVFDWDIWTCEPSEFEWHYDQREVCYLLEGKVTVEAGGDQIRFAKGDLVIFPAGLDCRWIVHEAVRKHYQFG